MEEFKSELETLYECRRAYWRRLLEHTNGSVGKAADIAKRDRRYVYKILAQLGFNVIRPAKPYGVMHWPKASHIRAQREDLRF